MEAKYLEVTDMWKPYSERYQDGEALDLLERVSRDEDLTTFTYMRDPEDIVRINRGTEVELSSN